MDKKKHLINNLKNDIYCRIGVSKLHGVGVLAIKDIPKNTDPFKLPNNKSIKYHIIDLTKKDIEKLNSDVKTLLSDFVGNKKGDRFAVPELGLNMLDISFYMNHSNDNNIGLVEDTGEYATFITLRNIKKGEELTLNYNDYD